MRGLNADGQPKEIHKCPICGQGYSRMEYLRRHQRKHNEDKPFGCNLCTKTFARSDVLLRHKRRCHPEAYPESEAAQAANALLSAAAGAAGASNSNNNYGTSSSDPAGVNNVRKRGLSFDSEEEGEYERESQRQRQRQRQRRESDGWDERRGSGGGNDWMAGVDPNLRGMGEGVGREDMYPLGGDGPSPFGASGVGSGSGGQYQRQQAGSSSGPGTGMSTSTHLPFRRDTASSDGYTSNLGSMARRPAGTSPPMQASRESYSSSVGGIGSGSGAGAAFDESRLYALAEQLDNYAGGGSGSGSGSRLPAPPQPYASNASSSNNEDRNRSETQTLPQSHRFPSQAIYPPVQTSQPGSPDGAGGSGGGRWGYLPSLARPENLMASGAQVLDPGNQQQRRDSDAYAGGNRNGQTSSGHGHARNNSTENAQGIEHAATLLSMAWGMNDGQAQGQGQGQGQFLAGGFGASGGSGSGNGNAFPAQHQQQQQHDSMIHPSLRLDMQYTSQQSQQPQPGPSTFSSNHLSASGSSNLGSNRILALQSEGMNSVSPVEIALAAFTPRSDGMSQGHGQGQVQTSAQAAVPGLMGALKDGLWSVPEATVGLEQPMAVTPYQPNDWNAFPFGSPGKNFLPSPGAFNLFDLPLDDDSWEQQQNEVEGWMHMPGNVNTITTPYPENPLLRITEAARMRRWGPEMDPSDKFYIPYQRHKGCYEIPHWGLPSVDTLSRIAKQTLNTLIIHVPILHFPTFKLDDLTPGVAFSLFITGSPHHSAIAGDRSRRLFNRQLAQQIRAMDLDEYMNGKGIIAPDSSAPQVELLEDEPTEEEKQFEETKNVVVTEKRIMLKMMFEHADASEGLSDHFFGLVQAMTLFNTPMIFSPYENQRVLAYREFDAVYGIARKLGLFNPNLPHASPYSNGCGGFSPFGGNQAYTRRWKDWIKFEKQRRTMWMFYIFDTLSTLETGNPPTISIQDVSLFPLPSPDTIWLAKSAEEWISALSHFHPADLQTCMREHFSNHGMNGNKMSPPGGPSGFCLTTSDFGMFGRLIMVVTLLRTLLLVGRGKAEAQEAMQSWGVDFRSVANGKRTVAMIKALHSALQKWRQGWDFDSLCAVPSLLSPNRIVDSQPQPSTSNAYSQPSRQSTTSSTGYDWLNSAGGASTSSGSTGPSPNVQTPKDEDEEVGQRAKDRLMFYEEALPYFWLCQALYSTLTSDQSLFAEPDPQPGRDGRDRLENANLKTMLQSARVFSRMGEGVSSMNTGDRQCFVQGLRLKRLSMRWNGSDTFKR